MDSSSKSVGIGWSERVLTGIGSRHNVSHPGSTHERNRGAHHQDIYGKQVHLHQMQLIVQSRSCPGDAAETCFRQDGFHGALQPLAAGVLHLGRSSASGVSAAIEKANQNMVIGRISLYNVQKTIKDTNYLVCHIAVSGITFFSDTQHQHFGNPNKEVKEH